MALAVTLVTVSNNYFCGHCKEDPAQFTDQLLFVVCMAKVHDIRKPCA